MRTLRSIVFLLVVLWITTSCGLFESPDDCRDTVIRKVPIYPDAQFVYEETNETSSNLNWGNITGYYQANAPSVQVLNWYYARGTACTPSDHYDCWAMADGDERIYYGMDILGGSSSTTYFSVYFSWMCHIRE